jgi:hypothetical protein
MFTIHRSRSVLLGSAAFLALALFAPGVVNADDAIPLIAPVAGPATDAVPVVAPVAAPSVDDTSADAVRAAALTLAAQSALLTGDIGSMQEEHLLAIVAGAPSWDATSGYGSVEASRAANALPVAPAAITTQVPAEVRWAPVRAIAPELSAEATRALAAQLALQSGDIGSMQEDRLLAIVAAGSSWDETSGYGAVEASRATNALLAPVAAPSWDETSGYRAVEASRATIGHPATSTT